MLWPGMTLGWIIAYDIWNIMFVYLNFPNTVFFTAAIVIAPTIAAIIVQRGTSMPAREYTVAIYMMHIFSSKVLFSLDTGLQRTQARRVGNEWVNTLRSRCTPVIAT